MAIRWHRHHGGSRPRASDTAAFVGRLPVARRLRHARDEYYFEWRYQNPLAHHHFLFAERSGDLVGYAVIQSARSGGPMLIADFEALDATVTRALLRTITSKRLADIHVWSSTLPLGMVSDLADHGFVEPHGQLRFGERFIVRAIGESERSGFIDGVDLRGLSNWEIRPAVAMTY
jgi:hypothetical protein